MTYAPQLEKNATLMWRPSAKHLDTMRQIAQVRLLYVYMKTHFPDGMRLISARVFADSFRIPSHNLEFKSHL